MLTMQAPCLLNWGLSHLNQVETRHLFEPQPVSEFSQSRLWMALLTEWRICSTWMSRLTLTRSLLSTSGKPFIDNVILKADGEIDWFNDCVLGQDWRVWNRCPKQIKSKKLSLGINVLDYVSSNCRNSVVCSPLWKSLDTFETSWASIWASQVELWWIKYRTSTWRRQWSHSLVIFWNTVCLLSL